MKPANKKFYCLTAEGESLWSRRESMRLPLDYRRILGLVDYDGHREVIGAQLAQYPAATVDQWLEEFETLRLIESAPVPDEKTLPELALLKRPPPLELEDRERFEPEASFAARPPIRKSPRQTVALVVEDDPDQLALALLRLTAAGYPVRTASGVQELFRSVEENLPDAIFLDVMLGDGDGFDALATLRRHPKCAHLPIIMVTSKSEPEDVAKGLALGCDGYITKPYAANTLEYVLRSVMKQEISLAAGGGAAKALREVAN
jgi:CheY-like chemotaxis protein